MHLVNGTGNSPSPGRPTPGVVKQDKSSGGSYDTTKTRSGPQRVRLSSGERPIGAAKGKQSDTEALCQPPPTTTTFREMVRRGCKGVCGCNTPFPGQKGHCAYSVTFIPPMRGLLLAAGSVSGQG